MIIWRVRGKLLKVLNLEWAILRPKDFTVLSLENKLTSTTNHNLSNSFRRVTRQWTRKLKRKRKKQWRNYKVLKIVRRPPTSRPKNTFSNMSRIWNLVLDGANRLFIGRHNRLKKLILATDTLVQLLEVSKNQFNVKHRPLSSLENNSKQLTPQRKIMKRGVKLSSANNQNQEKEEDGPEIRASKAKCRLLNPKREETV